LAAPTVPTVGPDPTTPEHPTSPESGTAALARLLLNHAGPLPSVALLDGRRNCGVLLGHDARGHIEFGIADVPVRRARRMTANSLITM
jgi:hypothetical protein